MAINEEVAERLRAALPDRTGIAEKRMFGGLCFMLNGNMLCGTLEDGAIYRVGKQNEAAALTVRGAAEMTFTGRRMGGFVELRGQAFADEDAHRRLMDLALDFVRALPAK